MWIPLLVTAGLACAAATTLVKQPRIAGGYEAGKGQFPWLVSLQATNFQEGWHLCGASLLTPEWVLIAAHCLDSEKPEWLWVVSGEHDTTVEEGTEQYLLIDYFVKHPEFIYWETPYRNDIALIHLSTPAILDEYTNVAPMPQHAMDLAGSCREAGWGAMHEGGGSSNTVHWADVPLLSSSTCEAAYNSIHDPKALCAGNLQGGVGSCMGDNGGGLLCMDPERGSPVIGGVMSWREGCAKPNMPAIYMKVADYLDWIHSTISIPEY
ncbi:trypsin-like [Panulirus ornatus]|uniref:trypsin-like n=1 Tax=Panulirus ornatus TaxID=150431 RepID=UPI003A8AD4EA